MSANAANARGSWHNPSRARTTAHVWTEPEDQRLAALWDEGLSSVAIAKRMATTKGSVLGRAHRLELPKRPSPIPNPEARLKTATDRANALARAVARLNRTIAAARMPAEAAAAPGQGKHPDSDETPPAGNVGPPEAMSETAPWPANDNRNACQWPIGHPKRPGFRLCSASAEPSKPYCLVHCRTAYINFRNNLDAKVGRVYIPPWQLLR